MKGIFIKRALAVALLCLLPLAAWPADFFIRTNGFTSGVHSGADWNNAFNWPAMATTPGGVYHFQGGETYGSRFDPVTSSTTWVRASGTAVETNAAGWLASFNGTVVMTNGVSEVLVFRTAGLHDVRVDGIVTNGFQIGTANTNNGGNGSVGISLKDFVYSNITLVNIECKGPFSGTNLINVNDDVRPLNAYTPGGSGLVISNCWFHGGSSVAFLLNLTNSIIQHNTFEDSGCINSSAFHPNLAQCQAWNNVDFGYNVIRNWEAEGLMFVSASLHFKIHDNIFIGNTNYTVSRAIELQDFAYTNCEFIGNTIVNVPYGAGIGILSNSSLATVDSTSVTSNNFWFNSAAVGTMTFTNGRSGNNATSLASISGSANDIVNVPSAAFVSYSPYWNASPTNFLVVTNTGGSMPAGKGIYLSSYPIDFSGTARANPPTIGAQEAAGTSPPGTLWMLIRR